MSPKQNPEEPAGNLGVDEDAGSEIDIPMLRAASEARDDQASEVYRTRPLQRVRRTDVQLAAIDEAIYAIAEEQKPLSVRAIYYRVLAAGVPTIDKSASSVSVVQRQVLKMRRRGALPYSWITDGTRYILKPKSWENTDDAVSALAASYRRMLWMDQPDEVLFFTEKEAMQGTLYPITSKWDVGLGIRRGYISETFAYEIADDIYLSGKHHFVYDFGDHDPAGVDQWRDLQRKVTAFLAERHADDLVTFQRIAVTPAQIGELSLPTRPTKQSDSRARGFRGESVDVDAIPPTIIRDMAERTILSHVDQHRLEIHQMQEENERRGLLAMAQGWSS